MLNRVSCSKRIFGRIDELIFRLLWRWARQRHPRKGPRWIKNKFERVGNRDWWFFGESPDHEDRFVHLRLFHTSSVKIVYGPQQFWEAIHNDIHPKMLMPFAPCPCAHSLRP